MIMNKKVQHDCHVTKSVKYGAHNAKMGCNANPQGTKSVYDHVVMSYKVKELATTA